MLNEPDLTVALLEAVHKSSSWDEFVINLPKEIIKQVELRHLEIDLFQQTTDQPTVAQTQRELLEVRVDALKKYLKESNHE